jgi:predicted phage terminase large subunit-like protein
MIDIRPHAGPQEAFLSSAADIVIFGGAAGGGKTWGLLLEPLRHVAENPEFDAVIFRRNTTQIKNPGGLYDQAIRLYPALGGYPVSKPLGFRWRSGGGRVTLAHIEHENSKLDWHGAQIPLIMFDELTTFTESQFWYLFSRNRSMSRVSGYIRASCNADADSWVAGLIAWWIDQRTGFPIEARSGVIRWFIRLDVELIWASSRAELIEKYPGSEPKSLTFIGAKLDDNPTLVASDPSYRASLMAMNRVERARLLDGNWLIRPSAGLYFQRGWCEFIDTPPAQMRICRGWDMAATPYTGTNDPDWTSGTKIGRTPDGRYVILDNVHLRAGPRDVARLIRNTASADGKSVRIDIPQEPAAAGKMLVASLSRLLDGYPVTFSPETGDKLTRFSPFSAQAEAGNVLILRGAWNEPFLTNLEGFPPPTTGTGHDDDADSTSRAYNNLMLARPPMMISDELLELI